jgi:hypothetical protein
MDTVSISDKHQQYLDEHDRLANLFVPDRFAFELERKRIINPQCPVYILQEAHMIQIKDENI